MFHDGVELYCVNFYVELYSFTLVIRCTALFETLLNILFTRPGPKAGPSHDVEMSACLSVCPLPIYFLIIDVLLCQYTSDPQYFLQIPDPL